MTDCNHLPLCRPENHLFPLTVWPCKFRLAWNAPHTLTTFPVWHGWSRERYLCNWWERVKGRRTNFGFCPSLWQTVSNIAETCIVKRRLQTFIISFISFKSFQMERVGSTSICSIWPWNSVSRWNCVCYRRKRRQQVSSSWTKGFHFLKPLFILTQVFLSCLQTVLEQSLCLWHEAR